MFPWCILFISKSVWYDMNDLEGLCWTVSFTLRKFHTHKKNDQELVPIHHICKMWDLRMVNFDKLWGIKSVLKFHMLIISDVWRIGTNSSRHVWRIGTSISYTWRIGTSISHTWKVGTIFNPGLNPDLSAPPGTLFPEVVVSPSTMCYLHYVYKWFVIFCVFM